MSPTELVSLLDDVFSYFDILVEKYRLEKIKTIGDCYMVAAGVPELRLDNAKAINCLALEMRDYVSQNDFKGRRLSFHFGINSGSVGQESSGGVSSFMTCGVILSIPQAGWSRMVKRISSKLLVPPTS